MNAYSFRGPESKGDFPFYYLLDYYPLNKYRNGAPNDVVQDRIAVYNFKDGDNTLEVANAVVRCIRANQTLSALANPNTLFAVIPASTIDKTNRRFQTFATLVCRQLAFSNGISCIQLVADREEVKGDTSKDRTINLVYNADLFRGRDVLLFDDVKTTGQSFYENAFKMRELGARSITGLFLAKTYSSFIHGEPAWAITPTPQASTQPSGNEQMDDLPF